MQQIAEDRILPAPKRPADQSSMLDLMRLIGGAGWGSTDEGGLATEAYPSSSKVPYAHGLLNLASEVMGGDRMQPSSRMNYGTDLMDRYKSPMPGRLVEDKNAPRYDSFDRLPPWARVLIQILPGILGLIRQR